MHVSKYGTLIKGAPFSVRGQRYVVLAEARAALDSDDGGRDILERKGPFIIYRDAAGQQHAAGPATLAQSSPGGEALVTHAVVLNERTGALGVVLGTIRVKLADMAPAAELAALAGAQLTDQFPHRGLAFYTVPLGADVAAATALLRSDPRVISAEPEILEQARTPR